MLKPKTPTFILEPELRIMGLSDFGYASAHNDTVGAAARGYARPPLLPSIFAPQSGA